MNTFSANSLKILEKNKEEFEEKYIEGLSVYKKDLRAELGQKYHSLICSYIKGYNTEKFEKSLNSNECKNWQILKDKLKNIRKGFIKTEYSFLVKNFLNDTPYYLTGRFDALYQDNNEIIIYDWKTLNLPYDAENDLQTIVYFYCTEKIYNTKNIKMKYLSIEKQDSLIIEYKDKEFYKERIEKIISKIYS